MPDRIEIEKATDRIKMRMSRTVEDIVEIGKDLMGVKDRLGHGEFLNWIEHEFGMTERTAQNLMSVAKEFGTKYEMVSYLKFSPKVLYQLAAPSTPEEVKTRAITAAEAGEKVTNKDID